MRTLDPAPLGLLSLLLLARPASLPIQPPPDWEVTGGQEGALMGDGVAAAGDVNGDGYGDVLVSARGFDNGEDGEGRVLLHLGSAAGPETTPAWAVEGNQPGAGLGRIASAGDVNGDGFDDVIVASGLLDNGEYDEGMAFLYLGSPGGLSPAPAWTAESDRPAAHFGSFVASAGDVDGDGYDDVLVGAQEYTNGELEEGAAFLYRGGPSGLSPSPDWVAEGNQDGAWFSRVASAGDVNGDGYDDVMVGAPFYDDGEAGEGAIFIYKGGPRGLRSRPWRILETNEPGAHLGWRCGPAGDVDGDGFADIAASALGPVTLPAPDKVYVFAGSGGGPRTKGPAFLTPDGGQPVADFGWAVASAGDVDGDGFDDLLVGARAYDLAAGPSQGRVYLYRGTARGLGATAARVIDGAQAREEFGYAVASAGDVDGDGYDDIIAGGHRYSDPERAEGRADLFLGGPALALPARPVRSR